MLSGNRPNYRPSSRSRVRGPQTVVSDHRRRHHLRELCDEVLASYRAAAGADLFSDGDRAAARSILSTVVARPQTR